MISSSCRLALYLCFSSFIANCKSKAYIKTTPPFGIIAKRRCYYTKIYSYNNDNLTNTIKAFLKEAYLAHSSSFVAPNIVFTFPKFRERENYDGCIFATSPFSEVVSCNTKTVWKHLFATAIMQLML